MGNWALTTINETFLFALYRKTDEPQLCIQPSNALRKPHMPGKRHGSNKKYQNNALNRTKGSFFTAFKRFSENRSTVLDEDVA